MSTTSSTTRNRRTARINASQQDDTNGAGDSFSSLAPQDKERLGVLNSRLAHYIERARQLEQAKNLLEVQIRDVQEAETAQQSAALRTYEDELQRLRDQNAQMSRELTQLQMERDTAVAKAKEQGERAARLERELKAANAERDLATDRANKADARAATAEQRARTAEDARSAAEKENASLRGSVETARKNQDNEHQMRINLQNQERALREQLEFQKQKHEEELAGVRQRRTVEMQSVSRNLEAEFEDLFGERVQELRDDFNDRIESNRQEIERQYKQQLDHARYQIEEMKSDAQRSRALENELNRLRSDFALRDAVKDRRIEDQNKEMQRMLDEYQKLKDTQVSLAFELQAYDTLLSAEESRLNLSADAANTTTRRARVSSSAANSSSWIGILSGGSANGDRASSRKRRRITDSPVKESVIERTSKGPIAITDADPIKGFVTITNESNEEVSLAGWHLRASNVGDSNAETVYPFRNNQKLASGDSLKVWSSGSSDADKAAGDIVMKKDRVWPVDANFVAVVNSEDDEVAGWRLMEQVVSGQSQNASDRCSIM